MSRRSVWLTFVALAFAGCGSDSTGPDGGPLPPGLTLALQPFITTGLASPVFLAQPLDDGRVFVVEQAGRIRVVRDGVLQTAPFLDISGRVASGGERGLLSVAFHPQYATNRFFFVYFTALNGAITIERFTTTGILYIADVGQDVFEEVNARPYNVGGLNYGWNTMEGLSCFPPGTVSCNRTGLILPVIDYPQGIAGCASVTGGYVYRGSAIDGLQGHYLYSD